MKSLLQGRQQHRPHLVILTSGPPKQQRELFFPRCSHAWIKSLRTISPPRPPTPPTPALSCSRRDQSRLDVRGSCCSSVSAVRRGLLGFPTGRLFSPLKVRLSPRVSHLFVSPLTALKRISSPPPPSELSSLRAIKRNMQPLSQRPAVWRGLLGTGSCQKVSKLPAGSEVANDCADSNTLTQTMIIAAARTERASACECGWRLWPEL